MEFWGKASSEGGVPGLRGPEHDELGRGLEPGSRLLRDGQLLLEHRFALCLDLLASVLVLPFANGGLQTDEGDEGVQDGEGIVRRRVGVTLCTEKNNSKYKLRHMTST